MLLADARIELPELRVDPELVVVTVTPSRAFAQNVQDATVAANVDAMLLWNQYTDGFDIDVTADQSRLLPTDRIERIYSIIFNDVQTWFPTIRVK